MSKLVRVSDEAHARLSYLAHNYKRTLSGQIEHMCESVQSIEYPVYENKNVKVNDNGTISPIDASKPSSYSTDPTYTDLEETA